MSGARATQSPVAPASGRGGEADQEDRGAQDRAAVFEVLAELAIPEQGAAFVERFYERFFRDNPEVVPLFGVHALSEREEMLQETLRSLLAWHEREIWLEANLRALGSSHAEYGVTTRMYPPFVRAFLETLHELLDGGLSERAERELGGMLEEIAGVMARAGREAGAAD